MSIVLNYFEYVFCIWGYVIGYLIRLVIEKKNENN